MAMAWIIAASEILDLPCDLKRLHGAFQPYKVPDSLKSWFIIIIQYYCKIFSVLIKTCLNIYIDNSVFSSSKAAVLYKAKLIQI